MFTFSFAQLQQLSLQPLVLDELLEILNLQGLEVKKVVQINGDTAVTVEVKANRAFCLSYLGLLREVAAFKKEAQPKIFSDLPTLTFDRASFPVKIEIEAKSACPEFAAVILRNINNQIQTPKVIADKLTVVGINLINPVVDILNFLMLETGQPLHAYDLDKIKQGLAVRVNKHMKNIHTLNEVEITLPRGPITIVDGKEVLAIAGLIGSNVAPVTSDTRAILIECAAFNPTAVRIAARSLKIHTLSGFRFERGVDPAQIKQVLARSVQMLLPVVGGKLDPIAYYAGHEQLKPIRVMVSAKKASSILGIELSNEEMSACLRQYFFGVEMTRRGMEVTVPSYRLDIKQEIDVIGEVARIYGYHNIAATLPSLPMKVVKNPVREKTHALREIMLGLGFSEAINYSFIPKEAMKALAITTDHAFSEPVMLQNPLSQEYAMMRPTLLYSLMQTVAYNYSIANKNTALFEMGRTYFSDENSDTRHREHSMFGAIFTGSHVERGFGLVKDVPYHFYDLSNYLQIIFSEFNCEWQLLPLAQPFFREQAGFAIMVEGKQLGIGGQIDSAVMQAIPNGKLVLSDVYYLELDLDLLQSKVANVGERVVFPAITREYNFWADKSLPIEEMIASIKASAPLVKEVTLKDIYAGKGVEPGKQAVLLSVTFSQKDRTLTADDVSVVEARFLASLATKQVCLGQ